MTYSKVMNIVVTIDDNYVYPCCIMLHTLFAQHKGVEIQVFLLHSGVSKGNRKRLAEVCRKYGGTLTAVSVPEEEFADAPQFSYFPKEMYYRLLAARFLPETIDRAFYLDPDMIVTDSLLEFYHMPLGNCFFAAVRDRMVEPYKKEYKKEIGITGDHIYVNSGVLLYHLKLLRKEQNMQDIYDAIDRLGKKMKYPDQDLINLLYGERILLAPDRYNLNPNILYIREYLCYNFAPWRMRKPAVIHYMGSGKPWKDSYGGGMYQYYWREEKKYGSRKKRTIFLRGLKIPFLMIKSGIVYIRHIKKLFQ